MVLDKSLVEKWVHKSVGTNDCVIEIEGESTKGSGFLGDVVFVKVTFPHGNKDDLHLAIKVGKLIPKFENFMSSVCHKEVVFYKNIVPIFNEFQKDKGISNPFNAYPKCYNTFTMDDIEVLVMENMKMKDFKLHPATATMNLNHIKLVLKNYARFHSISFAISDQRPDIFKSIENIYSDDFADHLYVSKDTYESAASKFIDNLIEAGRKDLADKYEIFKRKGIMNLVYDALTANPQNKALIHGDCHNNNILFKYENNNVEDPSEVILIDFQISLLSSPVTDLAYFFYMVSSKETLNRFKELMEFYHKELTSSLAELGTDVNKVFSLSTMWDHWKKYSFFGFNQTVAFLGLFLTEDPPDSDSLGNNPNTFTSIFVKNHKEYLERLVAVADHYFNVILK